MKVALITRSTLYKVYGGDTIQTVQTARHLNALGIQAEVRLSHENINYEDYDLLHFFNLVRPADILYHSRKAGKPYVVSTILCDYSEYDKYQRKGIGKLLGLFSSNGIEYIKTMARCLIGGDKLASTAYAWKGQRNSINEILKRASLVLPNSESEYKRLAKQYPCTVKHMVVPNGTDQRMFNYSTTPEKDNELVICAARIEGIKNQLNLIRALNNTRFKLIIIGDSSPNHAAYYEECKLIAGHNVTFIGQLPQSELVEYYRRARVHILPSWFETTGLSSIEAALMGCNIVVSDRGDVKEYFADDAFYCDPASPQSILAAVERASVMPVNEKLRQRILDKYTWQHAAAQTFKAYQTVMAWDYARVYTSIQPGQL
jgi:glycosyltransferase involved in cell wall biosynthesis